MPRNFLVTGNPGVGKTTFIIRLTESLKDLRPAGFYTIEMREDGMRMGFEIVGLDGNRRVLAHVSFSGRERVSKYGVDVDGFDAYIRDNEVWMTEKNPIIIDEIGKMECYSSRFRGLVQRILDEDRLFIATIAKRGDACIEAIKAREDVVIFEVTRLNRDRLLSGVLEQVLGS